MENLPDYTDESFLGFIHEEPERPRYNNKRASFPRDNFFNRTHRSDVERPNKRKLPPVNLFEGPVDAPWNSSAPYSCGVIGLHEEIEDFYQAMKPKEEETEIRNRVIEHITKIIHSLWPQAQVEVFGSFRSGLFLPSSDIDMVVMGEWVTTPLDTLREALERNGISSSDINIIANARVPIIKMVHTLTKIHVDISFNMDSGVRAAKHMKKLKKKHPALTKLILVLKQFLLMRGLHEVYNGGMGSYCLTLLVVSFLQGYHKLKKVPSTNLGTLLIEFFEHYGVNFNYNKVSIHFENDGCYKHRESMESGLLFVEDPLVSGHDVAKGSFRMYQLRSAFQNAYCLLSKAVIESASTRRNFESILHLIIKVDSETLRERSVRTKEHAEIMRSLCLEIDKLKKKLKEKRKLRKD